jgi:hypothetical protein
MQEIVSEKKPEKGFKMNALTLEEKQGLVAVFAWLIQEDKKQNPELYKLKKTKNYD